MISNDPLGLTELIVGIVSLILGFALSVWYDNRKSREELVFARSVKSRFDKADLDQDLREKTQVTFEEQNITSVTVFLLRLTNVSPKAISNQAFTVTFSKDAKLVSHEIEASEETKRFIKHDTKVTDIKKIRFAVGVIPRQSEVGFQFTVIGHTDKSFQVEHGFLDPKDEAIVAGYPISLDTKVRIIDGNYVNVIDNQVEIVFYSLLYFFALGLLVEIINQLFDSPLQGFIALPLSVLRVVYLFRLFRFLTIIAIRIISLLTVSRPSQSITIEGSVTGANVNLGGDQKVDGDLHTTLNREI